MSPRSYTSARATDMDCEEDDAFGEWDADAEEQLRLIESAYHQRRSCSDRDCDGIGPSDRPTKARRLPDWGATPVNGGPAAGRRKGGSALVCGVDNSCPASRMWRPSPSSCQVDLKRRYPTMNFCGRIVYSRSAAEVEQAASELMNKIRVMKQTNDVSIGFDIEWRPVFRRGEAPSKVAVMQMCMEANVCYVMHIIHSGIPPILKSLLEDSLSTKVGLCIANDAWKISKDYDVCVQPLEDLSPIANLKLGGIPKKWSLASLTETITCKQLEKPKKIRMGNWDKDVLTKEDLQYAATDAYVSWYLYQVLRGFPDAKVEAETTDSASVCHE